MPSVMLFRFERQAHSPHDAELFRQRALYHLAMQGYECVELGPPLVFRRGSVRGGLFSLDLRAYPHEITLHSKPGEIGVMYNFVYEVRALFPIVYRREMEFWTREMEELEAALVEETELPLETKATAIAEQDRRSKITIYSLTLAASFLIAIFSGTFLSRKLLMAYTDSTRPYLVFINLGFSLLAYGACLLIAWLMIHKTLAWQKPKGSTRLSENAP
jgi:hypothetical protein